MTILKVFTKLFAVSCILVQLAGVTGCQPQETNPSPQEKPMITKVVIPLGKDVTHILEPLDASGNVDYLRAANDLLSEGATPENNWEVALRRVFGPPDDQNIQRYYAKLGVAPNAVDGDYLLHFISDKRLDRSLRDKLWKQSDTAMETPWTAKQFPELAEWLDIKAPHLAALAREAKRTHHYVPHVMDHDEHHRHTANANWMKTKPANAQDVARQLADFLAVTSSPLTRLHTLTSLTNSRAAFRMLTMRARLFIGEGRTTEARADIDAIYNIGRLLGESSLPEWVVGRVFVEHALQMEVDLVKSQRLDATTCRRNLASVAERAQFKAPYQLINHYCRWSILDAMQHRASQWPLFLAHVKGLQNDPLVGVLTRVDWPTAMRAANQKTNAILEAMSHEELSSRHYLLKKAFGDPVGTSIKAIATKLENAARSGSPTHYIADLLLHQNMPVTVGDLNLRFIAHRDLLRIVYAMEIYRRQIGRYPNSLDSLSTILGELPPDPFSNSADKPFRLVRGPDGLRLYSQGVNGDDDGGEMDDIVISFP